MKKKLVIATRQSKLALWQANHIKQQLLHYHPKLAIDFLPLTTTGDIRLEANLYSIGGKGLFVKELEQALLEGAADIAVHSMKDVPMDLPEELAVSVICQRADPRDVMVANKYKKISDLPGGASVGTSSLRRTAQLHALRPDLNILAMRGNVDTRVQRLDENKYDAIILAAAGLIRLGLEKRICEFIAPETCLPAIGQGALGIECRRDAAEILQLIAPLNDATTQHCVKAERAMNRVLGGSCQVPIAGYAQLIDEKTLLLQGLVGRPNGSIILRAQAQGMLVEAEKIGQQVAQDLLKQGAQDILQNLI